MREEKQPKISVKRREEMKVKEKTFNTRKSVKPALPFFASFGAFVGVGVYMGVTEKHGGWAVAGFFLLLILIVLVQTISPGSYYRIDGSGVLLKRGWRKKRIDFEDIEGVRVLTKLEAQELLESVQSQKAGALSSMEVKGAFGAQRRLGRIVQFSTINIIFSETSSGHTTNITGYRSYTRGSYVYISLKKGVGYLISPKKPDCFARACRAFKGGCC